jgi:hypothetical protein
MKLAIHSRKELVPTYDPEKLRSFVIATDRYRGDFHHEIQIHNHSSTVGFKY